VFVALGIQYAMRLRRVVNSRLSDFAIFFQIISRTARFPKKDLLKIKFVF
jgi:hypothetical protein